MFNVNEIISNFDIKENITSINPFGNGHINLTYKVATENGKRYVLQAVNKNVFPDGKTLMEMVEKVTSFLKTKAEDPRSVMTIVYNKNGKSYYRDSDGTYWRVYEFVENSVCLDRAETPTDFYECGYGFGNFQKMLADFPVETLVETLPNFHNTPKRYNDFLGAVRRDVCGRAALVKKEIDFIISEEKFYSVLYDNMNAGKLPLRVTHNDTKINNVMLDANTRKAVCVIDLDTVMPGFSVNDFGDAIRFGANTAAEDEKDLSKVGLDMELFDSYTKGFLDGCGSDLLKSEIMLLPEGAKMMTIECGMRFLTDYLEGDVYFKTAYKDHNLVRCRTQLELVKDMNRKWEDMKNIIKKYL